MTDFPGFPSNDFDWRFEELGPVIAGLIAQDTAGFPRAGILPSRVDLVRGRSDWMLDYAPFIAVRRHGRSVLVGGTDEVGQVQISPAPAANARIDVAWTRPANIDLGEPIDTLRIATGLPAAVPSKPAIPAGAIEVAVIRVQAGATSSGQATITNGFPFTVTAGGTLPLHTEAELSGWSPLNGARAFVLATGREYVRRRGAWERVPIKCGGVIQITPVANQPIAARVTFPEGLFPQPPSMQVTANSAAATVKNVSAANVSTTSADVVLVRENGVATSVWWEATLW